MIYIDNINNLKESMRINEKLGSGKHTINKRAPFLPFKTRNPERPKFKRQFLGVTGEVSRIINGKELIKNFDILKSIDTIVESVRVESEEDKKYLRELVKENLINRDGNINIFHAKLFNYLQLTEGSEATGEKEIAQFIYDVIFDNRDFLKDIFIDSESDNLLIYLILSKLKGLESRDKEKIYANLLPLISEVAIEDFNFLMKHKEFLLKNFQSLLAFYYFNYIIQLSVKLNKRLDGDYSKLEEIYYLLDWESTSKNRRSDTMGYKYIKAESRNLLININIVEHLNFIFDVKNKSYQQLLCIFEAYDEEQKHNVLETLREWIYFYRRHFSQDSIELNLNLKELVSALADSLLTKIEQATMSRYTLSIEEIGKKYFLKRRGGPYGYMLNITQEMLLTITAVSIKEKKITLKELFNEYERRGLFFDQYSKDAIVELLGKFNLIDKKSDSGDAQYVKAIL